MCYLTPTLLVVSGSRETQNQADKSVEMYDVENDSWKTLPALDHGRSRHSSIGFKERHLYLFCGMIDRQRSSSVQRLDIPPSPNIMARAWKTLNILQDFEKRLTPGLL